MLFLYNIVAPEYFRDPAHSRCWPAATSRGPMTPARQPAVIVNETLARRVLADAGERRRQALAQRQQRMAQRHRRGERPQVFALVRGAAAVRLLPAAADLCAGLHRSRARRRRHQSRDAPRPRARAGARSDDPDRAIDDAGRTDARRACRSTSWPPARLTMFGVMTIVLAAIGIYGLVAYTVQQSTQEIGIRMAVGAQRRDVAWSFLGRGARLAGDRRRDRPGAGRRGERRDRFAALRRRRARSDRVRRWDGAS